MTDVSFTNLVIVAAAAFAATLGLGHFPKVQFPAVVVEILLAGLGFVLSLGLALSVGYALRASGQIRSPLCVGRGWLSSAASPRWSSRWASR